MKNNQLNYLKLIRGFWRIHERCDLSTTESTLYFYLLETCNVCSWKNPFKRNNSKILGDLHISINTLKAARNRLKQAGLIDFETKNTNPNVTYRIVPTSSKFDEADITSSTTSSKFDEVIDAKDKQETINSKQQTVVLLNDDTTGNLHPDLIDRKDRFIERWNEIPHVEKIHFVPTGEMLNRFIEYLRATNEETDNTLLVEVKESAYFKDYHKTRKRPTTLKFVLENVNEALSGGFRHTSTSERVQNQTGQTAYRNDYAKIKRGFFKNGD